MSLPRLVARRLLPEVRTTGLRMCHPRTGVPLRALLVVDVDLHDGGRPGPAVVREGVTEPDCAWEGVHAVAWLHGQPVGEATFVGKPDALLPEVPSLLRERVGDAVLDHLLLDAARTPGGLADAAAQGLAGTCHPPSQDGAAPAVSVVVCTRDRPQDLASCLQAVTALQGDVHEVLVVDNAPSDGATRDVVARFPGVRYVLEPRPGLDWARNRALVEATGDVVAFTDDDVHVHPGWVRGLRAALRDEPTAVGVTGLVLPLELATPAQVLFEAAGGFGRGYVRRWFAANVAGGDVAARVFGGTGVAGTGANMAFRRDRLLALGGFDPALDVGTPTGGGGDLEMFYRVVAAGGLLVYEPSAVVLHRHRRTLPELQRQIRGNGTGTYAVWLGAGRHYDTRQAIAFARLSWHWAVRWHLARLVKGWLHPELEQLPLAATETSGAVAAVARRLYTRAQEQSRALQADAPPALGAPVRPRTSARVPAPIDPVVVVDLPADDAAEAVTASAAEPFPTLRTRVVVRRGGTPVAAFPVRTHGAGASPSRLLQETVWALGPALLEPGHPRGLLGPLVDTAAGPAELVVSRPSPLSVLPQDLQRAAALDRLVAPRIARDVDRPTTSLTTTVLLCTRGRPDMLPVALATLATQTRRPDQLLVVDNNDDPAATRAVCREHTELDVVVVHEPRPGLSRARNAGLPHVTGSVLVFTDDDVQAPDDWLERLVAPFADPQVDLVTGNVLPDNLDNPWAQRFEDYGGLGRGPHRRLYDRRWLRDSPTAAATWQIGATANAAVRTSSLRRAGAHFAVTLGPGAPSGVGEDTELFYRVLDQGGRILYEPTSAVLHTHRADGRALSRQLFAYSKGHVAYHLEVRRLHGDARGLRRIAVTIPRAHLARARHSLHVGAYPPVLLAAEIVGHLAGPVGWVRALRAARLA